MTRHRGPLRPRGRTHPASDAERVLGQIERGEADVSPDAARKIAQRIEAEGGFWDHPTYLASRNRP